MVQTVKAFFIKYQVFFTAMSQVAFVAMNTVFISNNKVFPMLIDGFMISLIWTFNVKKVAFGNWFIRLEYATGAMIGTGIGYYLAKYINTLL